MRDSWVSKKSKISAVATWSPKSEECDTFAALIVAAAMIEIAMQLCIKSYVLTNSYFKSIHIFHFLHMNLWLCPR